MSRPAKYVIAAEGRGGFRKTCGKTRFFLAFLRFFVQSPLAQPSNSSTDG